MRTRKIGASGITASELGLGCMGMSEFYGAHDDTESLSTMDRALELGVTLFDTADMYGMGHNETLVGRFLKGRRDRIVLATKFGIVREDDGKPGGYGKRRVDNSPAYVASACDASLKRLGTDVIDLYYAHRIEAGRPIEETVEAMARLVKAGKVRAIGLSEVSAENLRRAHSVHPIAAVQSEYSLWTRDPEQNGVLATCRELGVTFVAYSPLGRGFLTGKLTGTEGLADNDFRRYSPRFVAENLVKNRLLVDRVSELAAKKGCSAGQLVLSWLLAQGPEILPIPGTRRIAHLAENIGAADIRLNADDVKEIGAAVPPGAAAGARYPEEGMRSLQS